MKFKLKDPGSAITHGIAFLLAAVGAAPLLIRSSEWSDHIHIVALGVFILTMVLLYAASTIYHSVDSTEKVNRRLRKMDHMMIFVMIAGSYTPVCLIVLHNRIGYILCALVWSIAVLGIILKGCWITCPKWLHSVHWCGRQRLAGFSSRHSGSIVRGGFPQCCISQWDGCVYWHLFQSSMHSHVQDLTGFLQAESFIPSVV